MWRRSLAGSLLVLLAALSVVEIAVDTATHRDSPRHQWEEPAQQSTVRLSHRTLATFADWHVVPIVDAVGPVLVPSDPGRLSPSFARVFVPPRL